MRISESGLALIKRFEGCSLTAYRDCAGVWTIGYGTTGADRAITGTGVTRGMRISQKTAEEWLRRAVEEKYAPLVEKYDNHYHWTQNEFDALVSFAYNLGGIDRLVHADGDPKKRLRTRAEIQVAWTLYCKADGRKVKGLLERRRAERMLFCASEDALLVTSAKRAKERGLVLFTCSGERVKAVQTKLARLGYDLGAAGVDGVCGEKTEAAIEAFQRDHGLTADGLCGAKTEAALTASAAGQPDSGPSPEEKAKEKNAQVNWRARVAERAAEIYPLCVGKIHSGAHVGKVDCLAALKQYKALSCNRMVSIVLQQAGLLDEGVVVNHTAKADGKTKISDAVKNTSKLRHCKIYWVNKRYRDLPEQYRKAGIVYIQNSNACISAGDGKIWSCNRSKGYCYRSRGDYLRTGGYPFTSRILVVIVPEEV